MNIDKQQLKKFIPILLIIGGILLILGIVRTTTATYSSPYARYSEPERMTMLMDQYRSMVATELAGQEEANQQKTFGIILSAIGGFIILISIAGGFYFYSLKI